MSIIWLLIKFYGYFFDQESDNHKIEDEIKEQLETFKNVNFYPTGEKVPEQDYRMPFILTLVLSQLKDHVT